MKRLLRSCLIASLISPLWGETNMIEGSSFQFFGPDDINLDPAVNLVAVDTYGSSGDLVVNGITFQSDTAGPVTANGVTVNTTATNFINGWSQAPIYTGADATSTTNFQEIMHDIRWSLQPANIDIDVSGLTPGTLYNIQLLFGENASTSDRHWDIGVDGKLVVDDWTSVGPTQDGGVSSSNHGYAYTGVFDPGNDGVLNIVMGKEPLPGDLNNTPPGGADNNPILQAVIVSLNAPPSPPDDILLDPNEFASSLPIGSAVGTLTSEDPNGGTHTYSLVAGTGDTDNTKFQINNDQLETNFDFTTSGGTVFSIRVQSEDEGGLSLEKVINVTAASDSDSDNLDDNWELTFGTLADFTGLLNGPGPGSGTGDFDGDGSPDIDEFNNGTDPIDDDSDDDGLNDGDEAAIGTNPLVDDTDSDGLNDGDEVTLTTNPLLADSDGDTIIDGLEVTNGTDPTKKDSDDDGVDDNLDPAPSDPAINSYTEVLVGDIIEFTGPDDLNLDPATNIIAVNMTGDVNLDVNGVTFFEDVSGGGTATSNGVTVTTTAANQINNWATPAHGANTTPEFTGTDPISADNLEQVMTGIRWQPAPGPILIDVSGLTPGISYEIQILTNEGNVRNRHWDIAVEDELVVDNYLATGREFVDTWTPNNSFAYVGEFEAPADGILNIVMQQQFGGIEARGPDNNPIVQGIIIHQGTPATPLIIRDLDYQTNDGTVTLTWDSIPGQEYIMEFSTTMQGPWIEALDGIASQGESTTQSDPNKRTGPIGFYRVREAR